MEENIIKEFLKENNITFSTKFLKHDYHFTEEKEKRDIFLTIFRSGKNFFTLRFGVSINDSTGKGDNPPSASDVLECIQKYDVGTFEDFINEFGYKTDTNAEKRIAKRVYQAVILEYKKFTEFFTDKEIEFLRDQY